MQARTHARTHTHTHTHTKPVATRSCLSRCRTNPPGDGIDTPPEACLMDDGGTPKVPPEPQPLSETCTGWHLFPQLLPGSH